MVATRVKEQGGSQDTYTDMRIKSEKQQDCREQHKVTCCNILLEASNHRILPLCHDLAAVAQSIGH